MSVQTVKSGPIDIGLPEKMEFIDHGSYIEIIRKWFSMKFVLISAIAIFWDGFLVFWYGNISPDSHLIAVVFPLLHVGIGVSLTYYALAGWLNRTHVFASHDLLGIRHRPLLWFGNKDIRVSDVKQIYAKEKISRSSEGATTTTFELRAVTNSGKNIKLVGGLDTKEQAIFIEQKIEKYFNIEDAHVPGEICK